MAKKLAYDKVLFTTVMVLVGLGLTMVYSASAVFARERSYAYNLFLVKQSLAAGLGLAAMWTAMHIDYRYLRRPAVIYTLVLAVLALLVLALFGPELNRTRRWLFVGEVSVQPSELAKLAVIPFIAYQIERKRERESQRDLVVPCALLLGVVAALILLQPDLGTAALICGATLVILFLAGVKWSYFAAAALALVPALALLIASADYRLERWKAFLDPQADPLGAGYQASQSLVAVGSGGLLGQGLGESVQKLYFLPHPHSDFIFSIIAEELGMVGALAVLALFGLLLWRGLRAGWRAPDDFGRYLAWGLSGMLVLQALTHISVALALIPTKGIPLPFISYGGSSLVVSMIAAGMVLNVSQHG